VGYSNNIGDMDLIQRLNRINRIKFSFSKNTEFAPAFASDCNAFSMYDEGFGFGIPDTLTPGNQLRAVFHGVIRSEGIFLFNLSGVDMKRAKKGFSSYDEAENNNQITEWELFTILSNKDYLKSCIFHNGKVQFKKRIIWNSLM
jgi:hypothetical protein